LGVLAQLHQFLRERLEDALMDEILLAVALRPGLEHGQQGARGDLLAFVSLNILHKQLPLPRSEIILEIAPSMQEDISPG
jgi:hypothetical protein